MKRYDLKRFVNPEILKTERLTLRKMSLSDLEDVYEYASCPDVSEYLLWQAHPDRMFTKSYLKNIEKRYRLAELYDYAIEYNGKMIGTVGFTSLSPENQRGEIGFVLNKSYWGLGIGREAAERLLKYGFEVLELTRIEAMYVDGNKRSERLLFSLGMEKEGTLKSYMQVKGMPRDICIAAITKDSYFSRLGK
jgi:ribosomal-protein-alanine N-acetyltransferase